MKRTIFLSIASLSLATCQKSIPPSNDTTLYAITIPVVFAALNRSTHQAFLFRSPAGLYNFWYNDENPFRDPAHKYWGHITYLTQLGQPFSNLQPAGFNPYDEQAFYELSHTLERNLWYQCSRFDSGLTHISTLHQNSARITTSHPELYQDLRFILIETK